MLPARYGDCLWIEYGEPGNPRRILIDGGLVTTYDAICARADRANKRCKVDLLVVTHVDADHIEGVVKLLGNLPSNLSFGEIWFNGWRHLPGTSRSRLGGPQGEKLTSLIVDSGIPWNRSFNGGAIVTTERGAPPTVKLSEGMKLMILSPTIEQLRRLRPQWERECRKAGLLPGSVAQARAALERDRRLRPRRLGGETKDVRLLANEPYEPDSAVANGSSIVLLAQFAGKSCLLGADAFPEVVEACIRRITGPSKHLSLEAFKVNHHGSKFNNSPALLKAVRCRRYLISTNSTLFEHPDPETIARILTTASTPVQLFFNYRSEQTTLWDNKRLQKKWKYTAHYPNNNASSLEVVL